MRTKNLIHPGEILQEEFLAPYDMRNGRKPELERSPRKWYPGLCREIETALGKSDVNGGHLFFTTNERPGYCSVPSIERENP